MNTTKYNLAIRVFEILNSHSFHYVLLRNFSEIKNGTFNDLDILLLNCESKHVACVIHSNFLSFNSKIDVCYKQLKLSIFNNETCIDIDLFDSVTKFWFPLLDSSPNYFIRKIRDVPVFCINTLDEIYIVVYKEILTYKFISRKQIERIRVLLNNLDNTSLLIFKKNLNFKYSTFLILLNGNKITLFQYYLFLFKFRIISPSSFASWLYLNKIRKFFL